MERPSALMGNFPRAAAAPLEISVLADVSGTVRLQVGEERAGAIAVQHGSVTLTGHSPEYAAACLTVSSMDDFVSIVRGELNAVVAAIQGRLAFSGDIELGMRVVLALNAAKLVSDGAWTPSTVAGPPAQEEHHAS
ncbi:MAG: SCP2 sterol-binding domain-containing protein [Polyangia bacterium]